MFYHACMHQYEIITPFEMCARVGLINITHFHHLYNPLLICRQSNYVEQQEWGHIAILNSGF